MAAPTHALSTVSSNPFLAGADPGSADPGSADPAGAGPDSADLASADIARWEADHRLVQAAHAGSRSAADALVRRLLPRARNLVRYLAPGDRDVEDFAQAALLEVLRSLHSFGGRSTVEHWADRIVQRKTRALLAQRANAERKAREGLPALRLVRGESTSTPYGTRRDLARVLDQIPETQREALVLFHVVGLSLDEVAAETGVPPDTAKSRIRLGIDKMRAAFGRDEEEETR